MKKLISLLVVAAFALTLVPVAKADTISDLMAQIAALQLQIAALAGTTTTGTTCFATNLKLGMSSADVKLLQEKLGVINTGYFGPLTLAAVKTFQTANGVPNTGFVGVLTRAQLNAKYCSTTTVTTLPVGAAMSISLAADNPASANVQKGSANNTVLKFTLTGGATATTVSGLTLRSYGTTEATGVVDVPAVKLYDESGIQIGSNRTPAGNQVNFVIVPTLSIPANGSRTITVTANIGTAANTMAIVRYGIESATGILGGATFTGMYPMTGNSFTIVPAGQLGSVSVSKYSTAPKTNVKVGEKDVILEKFNVSAGSNEDVAVNQITLTNTGTTTDSDLTNIRLRQVGSTTVLAGPAALSNKKVTFNLGTTINLVKGASINLEAVGDIADGGTTARNIILSVATGGVVARGAISGTNIVSTGNTTGNTITIGNETLVVSMSASHPQGAAALIIKTTNKKDLAKFDVKANGGSVILNTVTVTMVDAAEAFSGAGNQLTSVGLYDGDSLISDLITVDASTNHSFSLNYTIAANTTKTLSIKGITSDVSAVADIVTTTWVTSTGYGLSSGEAINGGTNVSSTGITIYPAGTVAPTADSTKLPYNQAIVAPSNNVTIAALKGYAQREDMKLTDLVVTITGAGAYDDEGDISTITLYDVDGTTQLSDPIAYDDAGDDAVDTFTIDSAELLSDVIFVKGVYKTILVKANIASGATGSTGITVTIADTASNLKLVGQDSGTAFDNSTLGGAVVFAIASPFAGGTYSANTEVFTMVKDAASPSGAISRGSLIATAIWNVVNNSSTNTDITIDTIKFTSKTGLPSGLVDDTDDALFTLYDGAGTKISKSAVVGDVVLTPASGTVDFTSATGTILTVSAGETKQIKLFVNTTDTSKFPSSTQLQWSVELVGDVTGANIGYAGGTWSIPAAANIVTLP